ncbi:MAG TPA: DUF389 domain-containing protein [Nakamurella sp.]|nr:DUF389 domain-containing protein [Nakamurella sp.]
MLHVRLLVPADLSAQVLALIDGTVGVANSSVVPGAGRNPAGDLVEFDAARECADALLDDLNTLKLDERGAISIEQVDLSLSRSSQRAQDDAPGNATDAVIWEEVESRTGDDSALTGTFLTFLTIATLLAGIGIVTDSAVTVVGAMVVGPEFGPLAAIAVGLVRRRGPLARRGVIALAVGFPLAMAITALATWIAAGTGLAFADLVELNTQTEFIYEPGVLSLIVALLAGAAGMLSLTSRNSAALVGVFISVTTVPAAGYVAVAGVLGEWSQVWGSALQLLINLVGIVLAGVATLAVRRWFAKRGDRKAGPARPVRWQRRAFRA